MKAKIVDFLYISPTKQRLTIDVYEDSRHVYDELKDSDIDLSMKAWFPARSASANAYAWVLINKIAQKMKESPIEVYRRYIRDYGGKTTVSCVKTSDMEEEIRTFVDGHIGRLVDVGESKIPDCVVLFKHYGSSDFTSQEMAGFLDSIMEDCRDMHIEVKRPEDIKSLLEAWDGQGRKS